MCKLQQKSRKEPNGVECLSCRNLFHQKCTGMSRKELNKNVGSWCCFTCSMPQITDSFFEDSAETCSLNSSTTNDEPIPDSSERFYSNINSYYMSNIKIAHLNINSIQNKLDEVKNMLNRNMFDILFIGETKLDDTFPANLLQHPGYRLIRQDRKRGAGGLMVFVRENLSAYRRRKLEPQSV